MNNEHAARPDRETIGNALSSLNQRVDNLRGKKTVLGFDGFIDKLVRVIREKEATKPLTLFNEVREFGEYVVSKSQSFSVEVETIEDKLGGNMPIMANALASYSLDVHCIGPLGYPAVNPIFKSLSDKCAIHSFGDPGVSFCLEFNDGKIILAEMGKMNNTGWPEIQRILGAEELRKIFSNADLIAMLNWSEIDASTGIWKGMIEDVLPSITAKKKPAIFIDLSDCTKRTPSAIREAMDLIMQISKSCDVTLSVNRNEASILSGIFAGGNTATKIEEIPGFLLRQLGIATVVLHTAKGSIAISARGSTSVPSFFLISPKYSTGAGDNFNAGFCMARLAGLDDTASLVIANATSAIYMTDGKSPSLTRLMEFLAFQMDIGS
jgi:hypothetical protein